MMREKSIEETVPVTLDALYIFEKACKKECHKFNTMLEICQKRIDIAETEAKRLRKSNKWSF